MPIPEYSPETSMIVIRTPLIVWFATVATARLPPGPVNWPFQRSMLGIDLISVAGHPLPGVGTKGDSSRDRGRVKARQPWLIAAQRIGLLRVRLRAQTAALE